MADYHPLDVRYKGPSTSYRGSSRKVEKFETADFEPIDFDAPAEPLNAFDQAEQPQTYQPNQPASQSPWMQKATQALPALGKASAPLDAAQNTVQVVNSVLGSMFGGLIRRTMRTIGWIIVLLIVVRFL